MKFALATEGVLVRHGMIVIRHSTLWVGASVLGRAEAMAGVKVQAHLLGSAEARQTDDVLDRQVG
ncbi:MAG: hypothetical protein WCJ66_08150, partial [Verrucomicrobiota bacterium]